MEQALSNNQPLVAIFIPVLNGEKYLVATLDSLMAQTYQNFEIVIVNDGSTDGTAAIAAAYAARDMRIRTFTHEKNLGAPAARNRALTLVSPQATFLMNHDSDDISLPDKLGTLVEYMLRHSAIDAVGSLCRYIDDTGNVIGWAPIEWQPSCIRATFSRMNSMVNSATLVRRKVYDAIAPFQMKYPDTDDYDFWARALVAGFQFANIPRVLHHIRIHQASLGWTKKESMQAAARQIAERYRLWYETTPGRRFWARVCGKTSRYRIAAMRLLRS